MLLGFNACEDEGEHHVLIEIDDVYMGVRKWISHRAWYEKNKTNEKTINSICNLFSPSLPP
jgi:hypothetical protein